MTTAIKLYKVINSSAFFYQLLSIHNYSSMTRTFYGLDTAGRNSFKCLDHGVISYLSVYHNTAVLSFWLSLEADYFCLITPEKEAFLICCRIVMEIGGWSL